MIEVSRENKERKVRTEVKGKGGSGIVYSFQTFPILVGFGLFKVGGNWFLPLLESYVTIF